MEENSEIVQLNFKVPPDLKRRYQKACIDLGFNMGDVIQVLIEQFLRSKVLREAIRRELVR
jgi:antitoxin component of RelBE/YafQ-DinJ toxin-antitoxin module